MEEIIHNLVHVLVALMMPPLLLGVINKTKALFAGRVGPPILQPYYDLIKLFQKGSVFSTTTTWVFRAGPVVALVTAGIAVLLIPLTGSTAPISFTGDLILLAYLLGLGCERLELFAPICTLQLQCLGKVLRAGQALRKVKV